MKKLKTVVTWLLVAAFSSSTISLYAEERGTAMQASSDSSVLMAGIKESDKPLGGQDPSAVIDQILGVAKERHLTTKELVQLSFAYLMVRKFEVAVTTAKLALGTTDDPKRKAAIHGLIAQSLALMESYKEAGLEALEGQRLDPGSKTLAAYRVAFFDKAGDPLQLASAKDYLKKLDGSDREPTIATAPFAIAAGVIISSVIVIMNWVKGNPKDDKYMYIALGVIWKSVSIIVVAAP